MKRAPKLSEGSVIAIPMGEDHWTLSQVLVPGICFYLGCSPVVFSGLPQIEQICGLKLSFFSWTNDAEIYRGNWKFLGNYPLQASPSPDIKYKVALDGEMMVASFDGELIREFNPEIDSALEYRKSSSPLLVQDRVQVLAQKRLSPS